MLHEPRMSTELSVPPVASTGGSSRGSVSSNGTSENVHVAVRFRPILSKAEKRLSDAAARESDTQLTYDAHSVSVVTRRHGPSHAQTQLAISLDYVFNEHTSQQEVFETIAREPVQWVEEGFNACVFAYGQTGSGKTYSVFGHGSDLAGPDRGIIPRALELLFFDLARVRDESKLKVSVKCSFLEIYKERIVDLFAAVEDGAPTPQRERQREQWDYEVYLNSLKLRESKSRGVYVQGLLEKRVRDPESVLSLLQRAEPYRSFAETSMNSRSSRSHAVFCVTVTQTLADKSIRVGKLNVVDLAGSENLRDSHASGTTLEETKVINKSLSALGHVIYALTTPNRTHIPYRDSTLTFLLRDSLGGNARTVLMVTCSPCLQHVVDTISTLRFAARAKKIRNKPVVNKVESIEHLRGVIAGLREQLARREERVQQLESLLNSAGYDLDSYSADNVAAQPTIDPDKPAVLEEVRREFIARGATHRESILMVELFRSKSELNRVQQGQGDSASRRRQMSLEAPSLAVAARKTVTAHDVVEEGCEFIKYPQRTGFFAKPSRKRVVYERRSGLIHYWPAHKDGRKTKFLQLRKVTSILVGKESKVLRHKKWSKAIPERCFSLMIGGSRSYDFEASSEEQRDLWVAALNHLRLRSAASHHDAEAAVLGSPVLGLHGMAMGSNDPSRASPEAEDQRISMINRKQSVAVYDPVEDGHEYDDPLTVPQRMHTHSSAVWEPEDPPAHVGGIQLSAADPDDYDDDDYAEDADMSMSDDDLGVPPPPPPFDSDVEDQILAENTRPWEISDGSSTSIQAPDPSEQRFRRRMLPCGACHRPIVGKGYTIPGVNAQFHVACMRGPPSDL